ncbi:MAG: hypothetical protein JJ863_04060 [Deltaproteobacteria bacterium]|nr:hypothetical protein [Deltaproteobacteria bacterium]
MSAAEKTAGRASSTAPRPPNRLVAWWREKREDPNPILVKELRSIFRTKLFIRFLYLSTGLLALIVLMFGGTVASGSMPPAEVGQIVFQIFFSVALSVLCIFAPAHAAASLTGEIEKGTYESLILTGMDPARIVIGKFMATYAIFALVLVAFTPVVGIAFLFGGISPWNVVWGFYGLLLVLAPASAYGVALSARLKSTRVAIFLALFTFVPFSMMAMGALFGFGELADRSWNLTMEGPFWFTEALSTRFFEWDTLLLVFVLPLYLTGMTVWLFLASAIAGVRPSSEDRSTPFKYWTLASTAGITAILFGVTSLVPGHDMDEAGGVFLIFAGGAILFYALIFQNEPPLPPRVWEIRQAERGALTRRLMLFGPGAAPTTRFAAMMIVLSSLLFAGAIALPRWIWFPGIDHSLEADVGLLIMALGHAAVALFVLCSGALMRVVIRSGIAARVLSIAMFIGLIILPFLATLLIESGSMSHIDDDPPFLIRFTPIFHMILAWQVLEDHELHRAVEIAAPLFFYGLLAFVCWLGIEGRVRRVRVLVEKQRAEREKRAEEQARISVEPAGSPEDVAAALARVGAAAPEEAAELAGANVGEVVARTSAPPAPPPDADSETPTPTADAETPTADSETPNADSDAETPAADSDADKA